MTRYVIVGVDPGTTSAVAAVDFLGCPVGLKSSKDMGVSQTVNVILSYGRPSVIASDVSPTPNFVSRVATKFGVTLFSPEKSLTVNEKLELTRPFETGDAHQRDALAAALYAYSVYKNKLEKIRALGLPDEVANIVLQGNSISQAKSAFEKGPIEPVEKRDERPQVEEKPLSQEEQRVRDLERRVKALQEVVRDKDREIDGLREELARVKRVKHIVPDMKHEPKNATVPLEHRIHELKKTHTVLKRAASGEILLVGAYPEVINGLTLAEVKPGNMKGVTAAFSSSKRIREFFQDKNIPAYDSGELSVEGGYHYIKKERLLELGRPPEKKPDLEKLVTEYRLGRK